jgi:hypothetical protein
MGPKTIKLPGKHNRTVLVGRTGTGKTVAGLWHLSLQDLARPWVILNFKNDEHIDSIENTIEIGLDWKPTKKDHGLYIARPLPSDAKGTSLNPSPLEQFLWRIWDRGNCGIFCDETFMVGNNDAFNSCLTQGRSKRIPMIMCTQRPVWISRFCFSEASYIQVFDLNDARDIDTIEGFVPILWDKEQPLGQHQSWYYEIDRNYLVRLNPVPDMDRIRATFGNRLGKRVQFV